MEEEKPLKKEVEELHKMEEDEGKKEPKTEPQAQAQSRGGWGWGFSSFSVLSDLQKAAEEISRNAAAVAEKAAKGFADLHDTAEGSESASKEEEADESETQKENADEKEKLRKSALDKLEKASEDSFLSQGLKAFDNSVEDFASGAWQALGSALKGGTTFVQKLEQNLVGSAQEGGSADAKSVVPSFLETGKAVTAKGMQVLEYVSRETMDLLISETGIQIEKNVEDTNLQADEDQLNEEMTFDRCFYIYGGPEYLEELEALSSHYALLFNRRKAKLSSEQKSAYDGKIKEIQQICSLTSGIDGNHLESDKGKKIDSGTETDSDEIKSLHDASVNKAADMAAGFPSALAGSNVTDMIQRTAGRLESLRSEGVHRMSEMCCSAVSHLLALGKSVISHSNKADDVDSEALKIEWPEESAEKAKIIRTKAQSMAGYVEAVSNSFITGISDVTEAYAVAIKNATVESQDGPGRTLVQEKANNFTRQLQSDRTTALGKIEDGLQYLSYVVLSTSMHSA